ncbi:MAG: PIN domain-containing protein [Chloroflexi bacterium]|nr:PIN domain-containing protein [Chloroflexota bacterium]
MRYCFLDTNIFIHCQDIKDIDWQSELGVSEICLVIAPVVFEELDVFKDDPRNNRKRNRARSAINFLETVLDSPDQTVRDGVTLEYAEEMPAIEFGIYNLNSNNNDDRLVASAICWSQTHVNSELILVSHDSGPRIKAKQRGLHARELTDKYKLPDQLDPRDKEIREFKSKLAQIENAQPKLQLGFWDSMGKLVTYLHASNDFSKSLISESELEDLLQTERDKSQYVPIAQPIDNDQLPVFSTLATFRKTVTNSQIDEYYRNVDDFLERYREYLVDISLARVFPHRSILLNLVLMNEGSIPAQNVEIRLDVEGSSKVLLQVPEAPPYEPSPPAKPEPRSLFDFGAYDRNLLPYLGHGIHGNNIDLGPPWEEWTREEDSSGLSWYEYGIKKIQHHRSRDMEPLYLCLNECDKFPVTVGVAYEVTADNLVDMLTGDLTVIVNQSAP